MHADLLSYGGYMKKILAIVLLAFTLNVNAFWNNNDGPWSRSKGYYGYQDNGIFDFNPYDYWDPRWYVEEMSNMMDEFDDDDDWDDYYRGGYGYSPYGRYNGYGPYNSLRSRKGSWSRGPWDDDDYRRDCESTKKDDK